ncbi:MAG: hypothetical protein V1729_05795 [Candidatus Woesearchaeota archaeon]
MKKEPWLFISIAAIAVTIIVIILIINLSNPKDTSVNIVSGHSVKDSAEDDKGSGTSCAATICTKEDGDKIYCPKEYSECEKMYGRCLLISCDTEADRPSGKYRAVISGTVSDESSCKAEYNDCLDGDEEIICKGSFDACAEAFDSCTCGTGDDVKKDGESLQPDFDSSQEVECDTGVFICERTQLSMSGDAVISKVTCKGTFSECAIQYGMCDCGDSSLTDFPTRYIGGVTDDGSSTSANNYWCDYKDKKIPCNMLPENCVKKKNTCNKGDDVWITCDGSFEYCAKTYGECLCGVDIISSGFMTPSNE